MNRAYIVSYPQGDSKYFVISASTEQAAIEYARNYLGDYRTDCRNNHKVELDHSKPFGMETFYYFTREAR